MGTNDPARAAAAPTADLTAGTDSDGAGVGSAAALAYARLAGALRRGVYPEGTRLPGERDLAGQVGVSRMTLRQALARLAGEGHLERSAQRGWFVPRRMVGEPPSVLQSFTEMARSRGLRPTSRVLSTQSRPATPEEARRLGLAGASTVLEIRRLRGLDDAPVCLDTTVLAGDRSGGLDGADLTDRSLYEALHTLCGVAVARSSYTVQAHAAAPEPARLLDLAVGAPVLVGSEVAYDTDDLPVLCGTTLYRGDAYRFQADLYRPLS
ncbi:GntR family transcriptional regulator [Actinopolymorpha cephalotaxi]|uniref:GntR family transcriptional regulator n=1 Tax=Actinopolymorpha cephalotaxi TaxID=504797 RepID=A0A1I2UQM6_9ACTN|nr:GntR family transcriptional regulator [Actinopolymorpha cephalotaxi]NYH86617.1 GntR family transcriptional regulator [Actinopolymorpha cephalotaxi]SFG77166.1 GntR family transcriptional regulator [Actinopolymorpha cephalotaxi]